MIINIYKYLDIPDNNTYKEEEYNDQKYLDPERLIHIHLY